VQRHITLHLPLFCYITKPILILVFNDIMLFQLAVTTVSDQQVPLSSNKTPTCKMSHLLGYGGVSNAKYLLPFWRSPLPCNVELLTSWSSFISHTIWIFTNTTKRNLYLKISLDSPNEAVSFFNFVHLFEFSLYEKSPLQPLTKHADIWQTYVLMKNIVCEFTV